ncbi:MAG: hypothetical protein ACE5E6_09695, partial [Phycisphaerae bacterium]
GPGGVRASGGWSRAGLRAGCLWEAPIVTEEAKQKTMLAVVAVALLAAGVLIWNQFRTPANTKTVASSEAIVKRTRTASSSSSARHLKKRQGNRPVRKTIVKRQAPTTKKKAIEKRKRAKRKKGKKKQKVIAPVM